MTKLVGAGEMENHFFVDKLYQRLEIVAKRAGEAVFMESGGSNTSTERSGGDPRAVSTCY